MRPTARLAPTFLLLLGACSSPPPNPDHGGEQVVDQRLPRANGTVSAWQKLPSMPLPRANHCSAVVSGYLIVAGGNYKPAGSADFVSTDTVIAARLEANGSIGPWIDAGHTASAVTECVATSQTDRLFLVDGKYAKETDESQVWTATIGPDGKLGSALSSWGSLPGRRALSGRAWIVDGTLAAISLDVGDPGAVLALRAPVSGGKLGSWSNDTVLSQFRGRAQYADGAGLLFIIGGYRSGASVVTGETFISARSAAGSYGTAEPSNALPQPRAFGTAVVVDDYVFVVGGRDAVFSGEGSRQVWSARIEGGKLGAWKETTPLPEGRSHHQLVLGGNYLYLTGGALSGPGQDTVFAAKVRF